MTSRQSKIDAIHRLLDPDSGALKGEREAATLALKRLRKRLLSGGDVPWGVIIEYSSVSSSSLEGMPDQLFGFPVQSRKDKHEALDDGKKAK